MTGGLGAQPPAANEFLRFSHKKALFLTHFFIEKRHAVSAVTTIAQPGFCNRGGGGEGLRMTSHLIIR